jgi:hypothetical protein
MKNEEHAMRDHGYTSKSHFIKNGYIINSIDAPVGISDNPISFYNSFNYGIRI